MKSIINAIAKALPSFLGGSADLSPSNKTFLNDMNNKNFDLVMNNNIWTVK